MKVRMPKNSDGNEVVDMPVKVRKVKKSKVECKGSRTRERMTRMNTKPKRVDASYKRDRHSTDDLLPLEQYNYNFSGSERQTWIRAATTYLRIFIAEGLSREEIKTRLNIDDAIFDRVEAELLSSDGAKFTAMGTAHRYYYYMLRMEQAARELDAYINMHIAEDPKTTGIVGAIKAKTQIHKDVMVMGQELGIINKRAKELRVLGELNLNVMPTDELKLLYEQKMAEFNAIVQGTKTLPAAYAQILNRTTKDAYEEVNAIIDGEYEDSEEESCTEETFEWEDSTRV